MSRLVVVTGGERGIGRATAARFEALGDDVRAPGRTDLDVTDEASVAAFFEAQPVDVLVNNAGVAESAPLPRTTLESWRKHLDVNATGAFLCTRAVVGGMRERGRGTIVTVASTAGRVGAPYTAAYTAAKHAAVGLMRATAAEVAGTGVTANAVCPTFRSTSVLTNMPIDVVEFGVRRARRPGCRRRYPRVPDSRASRTANAACSTMNRVAPCARASVRAPRCSSASSVERDGGAPGGDSRRDAAGRSAVRARPAARPASRARTRSARGHGASGSSSLPRSSRCHRV